MENVQTLVQNQEHEKILTLGPEYNKYKVVAAIHLERYKDALLLIENPCFEQAYCFYKLKNFRRSLKICKKLEGKNIEILKAQNLYFLGYYSDAYTILSAYGDSDEIAVNLSAMEALDHLNKMNKQKPSLFTTHDTKNISSFKKYKFQDPECSLESNYNLAFKTVEDERLFIQTLTELDQKYPVENSCIQKQLNNLLETDINNLGSRDMEISNFNKGIINQIKNPVLFQNNFIDSVETDFKIFKDCQNNFSQYLKGEKSINMFNDKLKLLKSFVIMKRKMTPERIEKVKKILETVENCLEKDIFELLISNPKDFQEKGVKLLMKSLNK